MILSLIVAISENGCIGVDGGLPWRLSDDLRRFKKLTMGHPIIMGRKTYESIGRLLPGRTSIVVTRQAGYAAEGALIAHDVEAAIKRAREVDAEESFIIGGAEIYRTSLPHVGRVYLTQVHAEVDGDTYFDSLNLADWNEVARERRDADERNDHPFSFAVFERQSA